MKIKFINPTCGDLNHAHSPKLKIGVPAYGETVVDFADENEAAKAIAALKKSAPAVKAQVLDDSAPPAPPAPDAPKAGAPGPDDSAPPAPAVSFEAFTEKVQAKAKGRNNWEVALAPGLAAQGQYILDAPNKDAAIKAAYDLFLKELAAEKAEE